MGNSRKRLAGESVTEDGTKTFIIPGDDTRLYKHTWTEGTFRTKDGDDHIGAYEYITDDKGMVTHEFFRERKCEKKD
jgi:hypothetical protein